MPSGNIFVISAPSGAGKSSLVKSLQEKDHCLKISISHTTRSKRVNETNGADYYFIDKAEFNKMLGNGDFLEHAKVYDNYYGTAISTVQKVLDLGSDILLEIDWQGAMQVKKIFPQAILIYILPPSIDELKNRLIKRNTDDMSVIKKRLDQAIDDISHASDFDFVIVNDKFDDALQKLYSIIQVHRLKTNIVLPKLKF